MFDIKSISLLHENILKKSKIFLKKKSENIPKKSKISQKENSENIPKKSKNKNKKSYFKKKF